MQRLNPRVVIVDDERHIRELLEMSLRQHGFETRSAIDGQAGAADPTIRADPTTTGRRRCRSTTRTSPRRHRRFSSAFSDSRPRACRSQTVPSASPTASRLDGIAELLFGSVALALAIAAAFSSFVGKLIAGRTLRPLSEVVSELTRFGAGDFAERNVDSSDSVGFGELAVSYNAAAAQVRHALSERTQAEADMRRFIADAAHEYARR